jgi:hypothetical protein
MNIHGLKQKKSIVSDLPVQRNSIHWSYIALIISAQAYGVANIVGYLLRVSWVTLTTLVIALLVVLISIRLCVVLDENSELIDNMGVK